MVMPSHIYCIHEPAPAGYWGIRMRVVGSTRNTRPFLRVHVWPTGRALLRPRHAHMCPDCARAEHGMHMALATHAWAHTAPRARSLGRFKMMVMIIIIIIPGYDEIVFNFNFEFSSISL